MPLLRIIYIRCQLELGISKLSLPEIGSVRRFSIMAPRSQSFEVLLPGLGESNSQRLGLLRTIKRNDIETPNLLALSSKGSVPHLTPDIFQTETAIQAIHAGFEDCKGKIHRS